MKPPTGPSASSISLRVILQKGTLVLLLVLAFALILLGKTDTIFVARLRTIIVDATAPILEVLATPAENVAGVYDNIRDLAKLREKNDLLVEENTRLLRWQAVARQLEGENEELRRLLNFIPEPEPDYLSARVIADAGGSFARSVIVLAGRKDGVRRGQAVLAAGGLVGTVVDAGDKASRILMLTDINSNIPVLIEESRVRAILSGDNSNMPQLRFPKEPVVVRPGDRITTSGDAQVFPKGIPIGVVTSVSEQGGIRVDLFVDQGRLDVVRIVDYGQSGIVSEDEG